MGTCGTFFPPQRQRASNHLHLDAASNRTSLTAPDGSTNSYNYDTLNRLTTLTNSLTGQFGFGRVAQATADSITLVICPQNPFTG